MRARLLSLAILAVLSAPALAVEVDGRIDPAEWEGAQRVTDFRVTQPMTGAPGSQPTEAFILATPEGLAVAFRNIQPASVPRTRQRIRRDEAAQIDRVNLMVDFEGGGTGYNFMVSLSDGINDAVITNETAFNTDWDGNWQHATSEDAEGWSVEMLIPWYIAPMDKGADGKRTLKVYLDRVIGSTGERSAWPAASWERPRFLSEFNSVEVPLYNQSLLAVTPYVSGLYDNISGDNKFDGGVDIFWKPNGQFQLTATINPDFGQVESDDIVVNFSANETFFSDKRPFFTENQGPFEFTTPSDFSQLVYTRRVGGPADDRSGPGDITAAVKVNGSIGGTQYGALVAEEADEAGRSFRALRLSRDFTTQDLGMMLTQVERPWLDRDAMVMGVDHNWRPNPRFSVKSRLIGSQIDERGQQTRGSGVTSYADYEMEGGWRQQWMAMHFGDDLEINDFGFLSRNNLNYAHWEVQRRFTGLPEGSAYSSKNWRGRVSGTNNDHGLTLQRQLRISRQSQLRNGGDEYAQIQLNSAGYDDRITRGGAPVRSPAYFNTFFERNRPRKGHWALSWGFALNNDGIDGEQKLGYAGHFEPTWFLNDAFSISTRLYGERSRQWVLWQGGDNVGSFDERLLQFDVGVNWNISSRQELRVKLQALGLDAKAKQAWDVAADGTPLRSNDPINDFSVRNLGFQVRYRYELKPLSDLYVVYGRGGDLFNEYSQDVFGALGDSFSLHDSEQLIVKLSYRFEL
ncbi:DUF5916 domain-containing protein [Lysobacter sp. CFH 32150]|uniref:DUF5916 domain-containing protein n=1 Tax=Lysobacter sp. CFH 32150 TaxID=2927128 RepID=UPI001FA6E198|nr:DUF5916 domain-containing protein [Lysobacter sp. CFH 32150]MCI4568781.1 DUF5916 domain-containing protein [Lysobacter sp. CFH 32150]